MKPDHVRYLVAAGLLWFALGGDAIKFKLPDIVGWKQGGPQKPSIMLESEESHSLEAAKADLAKIAGTMLPADRQYLADFYEAMFWVVGNDRGSVPVIADSEAFTVFHAGSLKLAIEREKIGNYPGLDAAIDRVYLIVAGADVGKLSEPYRKTIDESRRERIAKASALISWILRVRNG